MPSESGKGQIRALCRTFRRHLNRKTAAVETVLPDFA
jgi:hypothetical protein